MGVYLSTPITDKVSSDETCPNFSYGASSMQGWRMTQEDAHNCIPDFDPEKETALFAVYDGHGGAEVAKYCALKLPDYIKSLALYKEGNLEEALKEAFLGFDGLLTKDEVIKELKVIAGMDDDEDEEDDADPVCRSEADILRAEADMPIEDLLARYDGMVGGSGLPVSQVQKLRSKDEKFLSPVIHGKRPSFKLEDQGSTSCASGSLTDSIVARLEDKLVTNGHADNENNLNAEKELRDAETTSESDSLKSGALNSDVSESDKESNKCGSVPDSSTTFKSSCADTGGQGSNLGKETERQSDVVEADSTSDGSSHNGDSSSSGSSSLGFQPSTAQEAEAADQQTFEAQSSAIVFTEAAQAPLGAKEALPASDVGSTTTQSDLPSSSVSSETTTCSEEVPGPSGSGTSSSSSQSAVTAGSSSDGASVSSADPGPSGSGIVSKKVAIQDEEFDSEDSSEEEDEEYIEDSDEEEDEDDDEEEELDDEEEDQGMMPIGDDQSATEEPGSDSGCTAVVALLKKDRVIVANAGDSRCVLCRAGKAVELSFDHKPEDEPERTRIEKAGGKVTADGRVNGGLNLSRAIGDHCYKKNAALPAKDQMISALPDIEAETIGEKDEFLVLACDGIWNFMTSQEVVDFVRERLSDPEKRKKLSKICEEMFDHCLAPNTLGDGTGCDNMTCMIVLLDSTSNKKRNSTDAEISESEESQPEKRVKLEETTEKETSESEVTSS